MKVIFLDKDGIHPATPVRGAYYYFFAHGERGRGRWQVEIPLSIYEFSVDRPLGAVEFTLIPLHKQDAAGQSRYILASGEDDGTYLVLWFLSPGFRGGASYQVDGIARVLCEGRQAQGAAGGMGSAPCPVVHVRGACKLTWHRTGRLYGGAADWVAEFDGSAWSVMTADQAGVLEAMADVELEDGRL